MTSHALVWSIAAYSKSILQQKQQEISEVAAPLAVQDCKRNFGELPATPLKMSVTPMWQPSPGARLRVDVTISAELYFAPWRKDGPKLDFDRVFLVIVSPVPLSFDNSSLVGQYVLPPENLIENSDSTPKFRP